VARVKPSVMRQPLVQEAEPDFETYKRTQVVLVKSRLVLNAALRDPRVADLPILTKQLDPIEWLERILEVTFPDNTEIMRIRVRGPSPVESAKLVNAVTDAYMREIVNKERADRSRRLDTLRATISSYENTLHNKRQALRVLQEAAGLGKSEKQKF